MNVSIGERWENFVEQAVKAGRYGSANDVVREGLRLIEEREAKLLALRATLDASIAAGGGVTDQDLDANHCQAKRRASAQWSRRLTKLVYLVALALYVLTVAEPVIAKCRGPNLTSPVSLSGDNQRDVAIKVLWPSGSSAGWYLMFARNGTLVPISLTKYLPNKAMQGFAFYNETHGDCLHSDARYFHVSGKNNGFYVVQSTVEVSEKAEFYDDFKGATLLHELFRYEEGNGPDLIVFKKIAEVRIAGASCPAIHLIEDFKAVFPAQLTDGTIDPLPTCAE